VTRIATHALYAIVQLGMILLCAFYFFRDGDMLIHWLRSHLPMSSDRQEVLIGRFDEVVKGTVYGNTVIALMEGVIGGLAFWSVGVGIIAGPLVVAVGITLVESYRAETPSMNVPTPER
jgi:predicted PurR-regulated permease PerM